VHTLLHRQLRKAFGTRPVDDPALLKLLAAIDDAYVAADDERVQLERSLFLASDELLERNRRLEHELGERKRLEVELQQAEKLRAVGQLAAGVAHEINTPIQFIGDSISFLVDSFAELGLAAEATLRPPIETDEIAFLRGEIPRALMRCRDGTERVGTIVRALRCLAHPDGVDQQSADLHEAIHNTLIIVASELKPVADVELALAAVPDVVCHIGEIQQVLLNLLVNAAHAIGDRVGRSGQRGLIRVVTFIQDGDLVLSVRDDGAGVPPAARARVFEPFFTTKPIGQGTGQGLSIAHSIIVDRHGGQITFDSVVGEGTTFTIRLPIAGRVPSAK
jgi:two-component system, NtrC family, sensor kinase